MKVYKIHNNKMNKDGVVTEFQWDDPEFDVLFVNTEERSEIWNKKDCDLVEEKEVDGEIIQEKQENISIKVKNKKNGNVGYVDKQDWEDNTEMVVFREKTDEFTKTELEKEIDLNDKRKAFIVNRKYLEEFKN